MQVTALLLSHRGARWLPAVLDHLAAQTRPPDAWVAVETSGSGAESDLEPLTLLRARPEWQLVQRPESSGFGDSVRAGLEHVPSADPANEWVWLLHDDSAPAPDALEVLVAAAQLHPEAQIFGPKLREWPSLRRLLELGVTISGTGRRETGLERGEYDQGQHDRLRTVLAVNTAGMLVRRDVLEDLGFDPELPLYGNDLDFGWRAARRGNRTLIVPDAVVFHAEAAARGQRPGVGSPRRGQRAAALYTLLANTSARGLPWRWLRLLIGSLARALGLLLVRAPREAWDELAAAAAVLGRPDRVLRARRWRARTNRLGPRSVRDLLPPWWLPYRHGLDAIGDFLGALLSLGRDTVARGSVGALELMSDEEQRGREAPSLPVLLVRNPMVWFVLGLVTVAVVAARGELTGASYSGGALLPAPESAASWWRTYLADHHLLGAGSAAPAPSYLVPLALVGTLLAGSAQAVTSALILFGVPLAALSALRFFRRLVPGRAAPIWGALAYALLPVAAGATGHGRLGTIAAAVLLPWTATAALGLSSADPDRRWRAAWRTALTGALLTAFVPLAWLGGALFAVVVIGVGLVLHRDRWRQRSRFGPVLVAVAGIPVLLLPWFAGFPSFSQYLIEAGRADADFTVPGVAQLLAGRPGDPGAPLWVGAALALAGALALVRSASRARVLAAWTVAVLAAVLLVLQALVPVELPGMGSVTRAYPGFGVLLLQAAFVTAAVLAADGLLGEVQTSRFSWRQPVAAVAVLAGLVGVGGSAVWWAVGEGVVHRGGTGVVPAYMSDLARGRDSSGVLVLDGGARRGVRYELLRHGPLRVGEDAIVADTAPSARLTRTVAGLLDDPGRQQAQALARYGVAYVVAPRPVSPSVRAALDSSTDFSRASEARRGDAAWRLQQDPTLTALSGSRQPGRTVLLWLQLAAVLAALVLAAPSRRSER